MEAPELRPHFEIFVSASAVATIEQIRSGIGQAGGAVHGWATAPYAELRLPNERGRFWSPRLSIYVEDTAAGAHLRCRLGPKPDVWTLYVALYAALIIDGLVFCGLAFSKWKLGESHRLALWGAVAPGMGVLALYVSAFVGQRLARDDMRALHDALWRMLEATEGLAPVETEALPRELS